MRAHGLTAPAPQPCPPVRCPPRAAATCRLPTGRAGWLHSERPQPCAARSSATGAAQKPATRRPAAFWERWGFGWLGGGGVLRCDKHTGLPSRSRTCHPALQAQRPSSAGRWRAVRLSKGLTLVCKLQACRWQHAVTTANHSPDSTHQIAANTHQEHVLMDALGKRVCIVLPSSALPVSLSRRPLAVAQWV